MGAACWGGKVKEVRRTDPTKAKTEVKQVHSEPNDDHHLRITTVNMATKENQQLKDQQNNVKHTKKEHSNEYDRIEFNNQEERKDLQAWVSSKRHADYRHNNPYKSKEIDSVIDESSVIRRGKCKHKDDQSKPNQSKLKLDAIDNINCSQSMKSVLNFNPDDVITHK